MISNPTMVLLFFSLYLVVLPYLPGCALPLQPTGTGTVYDNSNLSLPVVQ
jgi:hypothetical protein